MITKKDSDLMVTYVVGCTPPTIINPISLSALKHSLEKGKQNIYFEP